MHPDNAGLPPTSDKFEDGGKDQSYSDDAPLLRSGGE